MVNSGQVNGDKENLSSAQTSFNSTVDGLSGSWQGPSYDSLTSQAKSFSDDLFPTINSQMEAFANACDLYEDYEKLKKELASAEDSLSTARSNAKAAEEATGKYDGSIVSSWVRKIRELNAEKERLKSDINAALVKAAGNEITAAALAETDFSGGAMSLYNSKVSADSSAIASSSITENSTGTGVVQQRAIDWATSIANNDNYGYTNDKSSNSLGYDCSGLVLQAYENAGVGVKEAGASSTKNMKSALLKTGFEFVSGTPNVNNLQPGDILWKNGHTEMYVGNGQMVGAHENKDGRQGDSSGNEINVSPYKDKSWEGYFRYIG